MPEPKRKIETDAETDFTSSADEDSLDNDFAAAERAEAAQTNKSGSKESTAGLVKRTREALAREAEVERETDHTPLGEQLRAFSGQAGAHAKDAGKAGAARAEGLLSRAFSSLKDALSPASIGDAAQASILWWHWLLFDRDFDKLLFRKTSKPAKLKTLTVHGRRTEGRDYRPTPALVFEWAMSALRDDLSHYRFVDYGAGRGRVLMMAAQYPFKSIRGMEFAEELFEDARLNIAQFPRPRMRCRDVACELVDATAIAPADGTVVHYFFAPFSRKAFAEILNGIAASLRESPRPAYLVLVDSRDGDLVRQTGLFVRAKMKLGARLESFVFSPYRIEVYRAKDG
ncbi:class I SAM-dependent methyltransferase [Methyloligella solikamskensis]|uniref:Class I SAM-dependent methyltransferase n=1 Tax=Methyloligella solikamskensis TaxID=1177756 RepID=A0ABW3JBM6_9HYPH